MAPTIIRDQRRHNKTSTDKKAIREMARKATGARKGGVSGDTVTPKSKGGDATGTLLSPGTLLSTADLLISTKNTLKYVMDGRNEPTVLDHFRGRDGETIQRPDAQKTVEHYAALALHLQKEAKDKSSNNSVAQMLRDMKKNTDQATPRKEEKEPKASTRPQTRGKRASDAQEASKEGKPKKKHKTTNPVQKPQQAGPEEGAAKSRKVAAKSTRTTKIKRGRTQVKTHNGEGAAAGAKSETSKIINGKKEGTVSNSSPKKKASPKGSKRNTPLAEVRVNRTVERGHDLAAQKLFKNRLECNLSYARKKLKTSIKAYHKSLNEGIPKETLDAFEVMSKTGPRNAEDSLKGVRFIKKLYPEQFKHFCEKFEEYMVGDPDSKDQFLRDYMQKQEHGCVKRWKETRRYSHNDKVLAGNTRYIADCIFPAVEGVDEKIAMVFNGVPSAIMSNMIQHYGSVEPGAYTDVFGKRASYITISKHDELMIKKFNGKAKTGKRCEGVESKEVLSSALEATKGEEKMMIEEGIGSSPQVSKVGEGGETADTALPACKRNIFAERREEAYKNLVLFYMELGLSVPKWIGSFRAMYMMDGDFVLKVGRSGDRATAAQLLKSERCSADSTLFSEHARNGNVQMCDLVAKILHTAVNTSDIEAGAASDAKDEKLDFCLGDLLSNPGAVCNFNTGTIRQPKEPLHQALHVDNGDSMDWECTRKILAGGEDCTAEEWLKCGYVVDMPLSQEGSWIRLAIPDNVGEAFVLHWVYIPYGSMLIRSTAVFHSGHYGSPGNCRYHAVFTVGDTTLDSSKLLYLHGLFHNDSTYGFKDWKLRWNDGVPESCQAANGYEKISWKAAEAQGTNYFESVIKPLHGHHVFKNMLWNLSPYKGLTNIKKAGKVMLKKERTVEPAARNVKQQAVVKIKLEGEGGKSGSEGSSDEFGTPEENLQLLECMNV